MQRLFYPTETVLSNKITKHRTVLSFKDSPRKPSGRRPLDSVRINSGVLGGPALFSPFDRSRLTCLIYYQLTGWLTPSAIVSWEKRRGPTMRDIWSSRKEVTQKEEREEASVLVQRLPYSTETVSSNKIGI